MSSHCLYPMEECHIVGLALTVTEYQMDLLHRSALPPPPEGICRRLQRVVEAAYPERVAARRAEIAAVKLVRESSRRREIDDQV